MHESFKEKMEKYGMTVNTEKRVTQPEVAGKGTKQAMKAFYSIDGEKKRLQGTKTSVT